MKVTLLQQRGSLEMLLWGHDVETTWQETRHSMIFITAYLCMGTAGAKHLEKRWGWCRLGSGIKLSMTTEYWAKAKGHCRIELERKTKTFTLFFPSLCLAMVSRQFLSPSEHVWWLILIANLPQSWITRMKVFGAQWKTAVTIIL